MHGGTYNANVVALSAGIATIEELAKNDGEAYVRMSDRGERLMEGIRRVAHDLKEPMLVSGHSTAFHPAFTEQERILDYRSYAKTDADKRARFCAGMHTAGIRITARGTWFLSTAHSDEDVESTLDAVPGVMKTLRVQ